MAALGAASDAVQEELEVLQSIFGEDLEMIPKPAWGFVSFKIRVVPVTGGSAEENKVTASIKFSLSKKYPSEA